MKRLCVMCLLTKVQLYLRELPEPVFKFPLQERLAHSEELGEHLDLSKCFTADGHYSGTPCEQFPSAEVEDASASANTSSYA